MGLHSQSILPIVYAWLMQFQAVHEFHQDPGWAPSLVTEYAGAVPS